VKYVLAFIAALALTGAGFAQHAHNEKGPNGGQLQDVAGVEAELLVFGNTVTLNVFDEAKKPVPARGFSASALVVSGADRETLSLAQSGDSSLKGESKKPIGAGATITIMLKAANGKNGQARFKM
jgi:hypothetical protein